MASVDIGIYQQSIKHRKFVFAFYFISYVSYTMYTYVIHEILERLTILDSCDAKTTENQTPPVTFCLII